MSYFFQAAVQNPKIIGFKLNKTETSRREEEFGIFLDENDLVTELSQINFLSAD